MEVPPPYNQQRPTPPLTFDGAVKRVLNNYAGFTGRASRSEFWWFLLFNFIVSAVLGILFAITRVGIFEWLQWIAYLALLIPSLAVGVRRLHDIGRGGGWIFINLIPFVGPIIYIIWCVKPSDPGTNRFGAEPAN